MKHYLIQNFSNTFITKHRYSHKNKSILSLTNKGRVNIMIHSNVLILEAHFELVKSLVQLGVLPSLGGLTPLAWYWMMTTSLAACSSFRYVSKW